MRILLALLFCLVARCEEVPINRDFKIGMFTLRIINPFEGLALCKETKASICIDSDHAPAPVYEIAIVCSEECHRRDIDMIVVEVCRWIDLPDSLREFAPGKKITKIVKCTEHHPLTLIGDNLPPVAIADPPLDFDPKTIYSIKVSGYKTEIDTRREFAK